MFTEAEIRAAHVLRVALVTPVIFGLAVAMGAPLPFVAGLLFSIFALRLTAPPPFRIVVVLALLLALIPLALGGVASVLNTYPFLMIGFVGLMLFHAFRLQAVPQTALIGVLMQTFAIMLPLITGKSPQAADLVSGAFALSGVLAVLGIYLAFALFPAHRPMQPPPSVAPGQALERTREAAVAALVMVPPFTLFLAFDLTAAMRVLFTAAVVLVSLNRRDVRETGLESMLSALMAGVAAALITALYGLWPSALGALLVTALVGLLVAPYAFEGPRRGAVALAIPLVWVLNGTADNELLKSVDWILYSLIGVLYAVWARALILRLLGWYGMTRPPSPRTGGSLGSPS